MRTPSVVNRKHRRTEKLQTLKSASVRYKRPTMVRNIGRRVVFKMLDVTLYAARRVSGVTAVISPGKKRKKTRKILEQSAELMASQNFVVREACLQALVQINKSAGGFQEFVFQGLTVGLRDIHPVVRVKAVTLLGDFMVAYPVFIEHGLPYLHDCCHDPIPSVARKAKAVIRNQLGKEGKIQKTYLVK